MFPAFGFSGEFLFLAFLQGLHRGFFVFFS